MLLHPRAILRAGINRIRTATGADPLDRDATAKDELKQAGQIVIIFALMLTVLIGLVGIAIDSTWAWRQALSVQRAADSASLAGVVYEPGADATAKSTARSESAQNGFTDGTGGTVITFATPNPRELDVTITTQVPTFFSRIFGINSWAVSRTSKAVYVTPVPMGSPLAYYGVYQLCPVQTYTCINQPTTLSTGGSLAVPIASQGFFGAIEGEGSNRSTGDAFAPYWNPNPTVNAQYTPDGYRYEISAASSGTVYLFDPVFCATAAETFTTPAPYNAKASGHAGAGDHWLGTPVPADTYFILWDTNNLPLAPASWTKVIEKDEINQNMVDKSTTYGYGSTYSDSGGGIPAGAVDCQNNPEHNKWVALSGVTAGHTYSLQVTTTDPASPASNRNEMFENMFSIAVTGAGSTVHGTGSMETYANIAAGSQQFYLAQIDRTAGAGKTVEIDLFDPGDNSYGSWMQVMIDSPSGWQIANFSYTADNGRSNANTNCLQTYGGSGSPPAGCGETATSGGIFYQNSWVSIMVTLPTTYGSPSLANSGWWKINYIVAGASDTTTWQVSIRGNPVHIVG